MNKMHDEKGKIIATMSILQGNGAKYFATNLSYYLKNHDKKNKPKVLLIDFDFDTPYLAHEYVKDDNVHGVDNLINTINSDSLTDSLYLDNVIKTPFGVDVIKGTSFPENKRIFTRNIIENILAFAKELYDYTVVVVGNKPNDAGMVYTLMNADSVVLVSRNDYSNVMRAPKIIDSVNTFYMGENEIYLVHNCKNLNSKADLNAVFSKDEVRVIGVLCYDEKTIDNLNLLKKRSFFNKPLNEKEFRFIAKKLTDEGSKKIVKGGS